METRESQDPPVYISKPENLDPERVIKVLGPWKVYSWNQGYRFESPRIGGLPLLEMVISRDAFHLQPSNWTQKDPRIFLRNVGKVEIHGEEIEIESEDGSCYIWQQGLKARLLFSKVKKGRRAEVSVSFGDPL
ncbi:hypothetical protein A2W45_02290 [Candidatus Curtissbacteria bacterium RIFCSPHIGHO2_12_41_11]|uniref:Uncharacterized protein n=3 Tax=Candidatus Curtissiibacteriota TaxID=1752717 RepID=A0A1F5HP97_9BACT|nr:MAG: hypothetical protein UU56_C0002G0081 [Candidatus Curtissbacteria bacterium GW2011_GWA2_41_24]OGD99006.1 MAG: hypothetical protein A2W45_02290 [Candidatus Curtissbacteria bacterium RIFCSPHIGHO2_12_41_11]OGE05956.1 MAG: hypothetical protein A2W70_05645 [Candidatus Curtissbacteria bacterium RIFCSPLOWO2_02_41_11]